MEQPSGIEQPKTSTYSELRAYAKDPTTGLYTLSYQSEVPAESGVIVARMMHPKIVEKGSFLIEQQKRAELGQLRWGFFHSGRFRGLFIVSEQGEAITMPVPPEYPANHTHHIDPQNEDIFFAIVADNKEAALRQINNWQNTIPMKRQNSK